MVIAIVIVIVMLAIAIWVPKDPVEHKSAKLPSITSLLEVYKDREFRKVISLLLILILGVALGVWLLVTADGPVGLLVIEEKNYLLVI